VFSLLGSALAGPTIDATKVKTFGTAIKNGHLTTSEQTIFEHSCVGGGVVTEMWMTGGWAGFDQTQVRIYVDGESTPSIDYRLYMALGIGFGDDSTWQGNEILGKTAHGGGAYHTYRIPFTSSIKITANLAYQADNVFWFIVRGLENTPVILGDLLLPADTKLKLYKNTNVTVQPYDYTTLATSPKGGAVFMVTIQAASSDLNFLEACVRAYIDGAARPQYLSSGTEDFFLSAFYYNGGLFTNSQSGLTHFDTQSNPNKLSMYKLFWRDPVIFSNGLKLVWRNMEDADCPTAWPPASDALSGDTIEDPEAEGLDPLAYQYKSRRVPDAVQTATAQQTDDGPKVAPMTYTSYTWVYEWSSN